jgi:alpha-tubulin suppressor-like RCC1 family protein
MRLKLKLFMLMLALFIFSICPAYALPSKIIAISAGPSHCLALGDDGSVWEWGSNWAGALNGVNDDKPHPTPIQVPIANVKMISAGMFQNLALKDDGTVWVWGNSAYGNLGNFTGKGTFTPIQVPITNVSSTYAGKAWCFAIKDDGSVWAWGANHYGQLGDGTFESSARPVQVKIINISYIEGRGCFAIKDDMVWAWGDNVYDIIGNRTFTGVLGDDSPNMTRPEPFKVDGLSGVTGIAHGETHTLILYANGTVWAWGKDNYGQLGDGKVTGMFEYHNTPIASKINGVKAVSAGGTYSMALKNDGTVWTWGSIQGYIGSIVPQKVNGLNNITMISAGDDHCMALKDDGTVWVWGLNDKGQAGDGTSDLVVSTPVRINFQSMANDSSAANAIVSSNTASPTPTVEASQSANTANPSRDNGLAFKLLGVVGLIILVGGVICMIFINRK